MTTTAMRVSKVIIVLDLLSKGIKRQGYDQGLIVGSKRIKQFQGSSDSTSISRRDNSFMDWTSNMVKGLSSLNKEDSSSLTFTFACTNDVYGKNNQENFMCNEIHDSANQNTGFKSIFQFLYCRNINMFDTGIENVDDSIEEPEEVVVADKTSLENLPRSRDGNDNNYCKQIVVSNKEVNPNDACWLSKPWVFAVGFACALHASETDLLGDKASDILVSNRAKHGVIPSNSLDKQMNSTADRTCVDVTLAKNFEAKEVSPDYQSTIVVQSEIFHAVKELAPVSCGYSKGCSCCFLVFNAIVVYSNGRKTLEDDIISDNEMRLEDEGISDIPPEESQPHRPPKRKDTCKRSKVWDHFIAYTNGEGKPRAKYFHNDFMPNRSYGKIGLPLKYNWVMVRKVVKVLRYFYDLTNRVSSLYVTSNTFLDEISDVDDLLNEWINGDDVDLVDMARQMKAKFDKIWGNIEKMNMMLYVIVMLDPHNKFFYLRYIFKNVYGSEIGEKMGDLAKSTLYDVFEEYKKMYSSTTSRPCTTSSSESSHELDDDIERTAVRDKRKKWKQMVSEIGCGISQNWIVI
ncbi:UNVERIFIED_CONTAM: hypothetical protein Sradi_2505400 [Sesamum radiatum]|uniref:hAT-like transposase RNase-H fold domain-containing protein n=1 Tax=Sesamum radiatum TaxID=300843 RepID=A0AAW2SJY1_SESRA